MPPTIRQLFWTLNGEPPNGGIPPGTYLIPANQQGAPATPRAPAAAPPAQQYYRTMNGEPPNGGIPPGMYFTPANPQPLPFPPPPPPPAPAASTPAQQHYRTMNGEPPNGGFPPGTSFFAVNQPAALPPPAATAPPAPLAIAYPYHHLPPPDPRLFLPPQPQPPPPPPTNNIMFHARGRPWTNDDSCSRLQLPSTCTVAQLIQCLDGVGVWETLERGGDWVLGRQFLLGSTDARKAVREFWGDRASPARPVWLIILY
ncbi:MAG: hypothetical protein L6R40_002781 [Gallowayella cf. fulva]|nr:MAG: hypothetical protein L6R40_002781 [Xanthomendoza cf. fulva]